MYDLNLTQVTLDSTRKVINLGLLDNSTGEILNTNENIYNHENIFIYQNTDTLEKVYLITEVEQDIINFYDSNNLFIGTFEKIEKFNIEDILDYMSADVYIDY